MIARGIEAGWPRRLRLGSREPVRHLPHAPKRKARKTKFRDWVSARQRFESKLKLPHCESQPCAIGGTNDGQNDSPFRSHFHADDK